MGYQVVRETEWILAKLWNSNQTGRVVSNGGVILRMKSTTKMFFDFQDKRTNERIVLISPFFLPYVLYLFFMVKGAGT